MSKANIILRYPKGGLIPTFPKKEGCLTQPLPTGQAGLLFEAYYFNIIHSFECLIEI